jgi:uncharacterized damage-inducible protein DinB
MIKQSLHGQLASMKEYFDRSTRVLTEEDSNFAPAPGMLTAAQQIAHAAQTVDWFMTGAFSPEGFPMDFEEQAKAIHATTSITTARDWLDRAFAAAQQVIEAHSDQDWTAPLPPGPIMGGQPRYAIFGGLNDHTAHHRGALSVYSRLLGKVPAMPYMDM